MGNEIDDLGVVMWDGATALRLRSRPTTGGNNIIESLPLNTRIQVVKSVAGCSSHEFIEHLDASWPEYKRLYAHPFTWSWTRSKMHA